MSVLGLYNTVLTIKPAKPCDENGAYLPPHTRPQVPPRPPANPWHPFDSRIDFDFAYYHFAEVQNSAPLIDKALGHWAAAIMESGRETPWKNSKELYATIDAIQDGNSPWKVHEFSYRGPLPEGSPPSWMTQTYELCVRDARQVLHHQLQTSEFKDKINLIPYRQFGSNDERERSNLMSADWAWQQAVCHRIIYTFI